MDKVEQFVEFYLTHGEYDPGKAHEYYMKTRQLKGRQPAAAKAPSYVDKQRQMDIALRKLGDGAKDRAKTMPKLSPAQQVTAKNWIQTAEKYDALYKSSGMEKKESAITDSNLTDEQKNSALQTMYKNPVYKRLDVARDAMFKTFLAKPEIMRYYEIQDAQKSMKEKAVEGALYKKEQVKEQAVRTSIANAAKLAAKKSVANANL